MKRTTVEIDDKLMAEAQKLTGLKTKREAIDFALRELVRRRGQRKLLELQGTVDWEGDLNTLRRIDRN